MIKEIEGESLLSLLFLAKKLNSEAEPKAVKDKIEMMRLKEKVKNIEEVKHQRWWSRIYLWRKQLEG